MEKYPEDIVWYLNKDSLLDLIKSGKEIL